MNYIRLLFLSLQLCFTFSVMAGQAESKSISQIFEEQTNIARKTLVADKPVEIILLERYKMASQTQPFHEIDESISGEQVDFVLRKLEKEPFFGAIRLSSMEKNYCFILSSGKIPKYQGFNNENDFIRFSIGHELYHCFSGKDDTIIMEESLADLFSLYLNRDIPIRHLIDFRASREKDILHRSDLVLSGFDMDLDKKESFGKMKTRFLSRACDIDESYCKR